MNTETGSELTHLSDARLIDTGRAADLQWFTFRGDAEYALHVMCPWRLVGPEGLVVGYSDYWRPASEDVPEDEFDHGAVGTRLRDVRNSEFGRILATQELRVLAFAADKLGGFTLTISSGYHLAVFPDASRAAHDEVEFWRLFRPGQALPHFVVSSDGIDGPGAA